MTKKNQDTMEPIQLHCLAFCSREDNRWRAVVLEMDIWGFGDSEEEAKANLEELIEIQVEFATGRKELDLLDHPAEQKWFKLWDELEQLKQKT